MKKSFLMKFADFLNKLHRIQWEKYDRDSNTLVSRKGNWELSYRIIEMDGVEMAKKFPLQVQVYVRFQGKVVTTWGCENTEDNAEFLLFFKRRKSDLIEAEYQAERKLEKLGEEMWDTL